MKYFDSQTYRFLLAVFITIIISILFIKPGYRYNIDVFQKTPLNIENRSYYYDLNNDGKTERLLKYYPSINKISIIVYNSNSEIINQFNFKGKFVEKSEPLFIDYDANGFKEVYLFTYQGDSLFINIFEPYRDTNQIICSRFIDIAKLEDGEAKYCIIGSAVEDVNKDGYSEIYFAVSAGFTLTPRNLYYYDIKNDFIKKSPVAGTGPRYSLNAADIDNDGFIELWGPVPAFGNYKTTVPYTDHSTWLMVFSHNLDFEFEPIEFKEFPAGVSPILYQSGRETFLIVAYKYYGNKKNLHNQLLLYTPKGELINKVNLDTLGVKRIENCFVDDQEIFIHDSDQGILMKFDKNLKVLGKIQNEELEGSLYGPFDFDNDNSIELLVLKNNSIYFLDGKGKRISETILENAGGLTSNPSYINNYKGFKGFHLITNNYNYLFSIEKSKRWLIFSIKLIVLFVLIYSTVFLIQYIQIIQDRKKQKFEKTLREFQFIAIKKQINPHFIFNALNTISSMYLKGDLERADGFLVSFSKLIREVLESSDKTIVSLSTELELIRKYLELEQIRLGPEFKFTIEIPDDCLDVQIPSMSLHAFVENSIKHGLAPKSGNKNISISAHKNKRRIDIIVQDNGVGFGSGKKSDFSTGKGHKMVSQMFKAYKQLTGRKISYLLTEPDTGGVKITTSIYL